MTLLVARQCRLSRAAGSLRRLPAASTTRAYADDASPGPFRIRRIAPHSRGAPPTATAKLPRAPENASTARGDARLSSTTTPSTSPDGQPPGKHSAFVTPDLKDCEFGAVDSAVLVPASVTATTPAQFVDKIEPQPAHAVNGNDLVVFLATPSFASWLLDESVFLEKALAQLYKNIGWSASVLAVCAVVDRLPQPRAVRGQDDEDPIRAAMAERALHPPVNETGVEGIAYVVLPRKAALSVQPPVSGEQGCIDFVAHGKTSKKFGKCHDRVRVPLANTVFQTGVPSTLISTAWSLSTGGKLKMQSRRQLKALSIDLSAQRLGPPSQSQSPRHLDVPALSIPLIPLTFPREVNGHMGNIIRGLRDAHGNAMTASTELEQVVPRYFKTRGEPPQATSAWAVVANKKSSQALVQEDAKALLETGETNTDRQLGPEHLWKADPPHWNTHIQRAFARRARLHKVLSGGGGWGKKAGLLSLDPMPLGAPQHEPTAEMDGDYETVDDFSTALRPVVEDGDYIQFFASPTVAQDQNDDAGVHDQEWSPDTRGQQPWSWEFGVIPSTIDCIPSDSPRKSSEAAGEITVHRGTFGALTEGALTLMHGYDMNEKTGIARKEVHTTTVDVPFARWSAVRVVPKEGVELKTLGEMRAGLDTQRNKKHPVRKRTSNVSVRDLTNSTFATPERPIAAPLSNAIRTTQQTRTFSSTGASGERRAWLPFKQYGQRKLNKGKPSTEQDQPAQTNPKTGADSQYPPETVRAILGNLKIPVWKRVTIRKVRHDFDDVQWPGQKDRNMLIRRTKTTAPSVSPEPHSKLEPARKMAMYRPSGSTNPEAEADMLDFNPNPFLDPASSTTLLELGSITSPTGRGASRNPKDKRTLSTSPKRPDTIVNEWDFDASPSGESKRSFSTTHRLNKFARERSKRNRRLQRAELGLPPVLRPVNVAPRLVVRKVYEKPGSDRGEDAASTPDSLPAQHAPVPPRSKCTPQSRSPKPNGPKVIPQKTTKSGATGLPRLLRQLRGEVAPRQSHERANGEAEQDFAKLEGFLWKGYYRVVSSVRKIEKEVPMKNGIMRTKRMKGEVKQDGAVRRIRIATPSRSPDKLAQQYFASMQTTARYLAMLTRQLESITRLDASQLPTWIASQRRTARSPSLGRKRRLIRTVRLASPRTSKAKSRPRIIIPRRRKLPHRNPSGLDFILRSLPIDIAPTSPHSTPRPIPTSLANPAPSSSSSSSSLSSSLSSSSSSPSDPASPAVVAFYSLFNRSMLVNIMRHRPALLRKYILPGLHHQATRMVRRAQMLAAQARVMLPHAPVMISAYATRGVPRARPSQKAPAVRTATQAKTRTGEAAQEGTPRRIRECETTPSPRARTRTQRKAVRARRVPLGGWKHMYKYFAGGRAPRIRKYADGELRVTKVARKSARQELADDVEEWLTGDALDGVGR